MKITVERNGCMYESQPAGEAACGDCDLWSGPYMQKCPIDFDHVCAAHEIHFKTTDSPAYVTMPAREPEMLSISSILELIRAIKGEE